MMRLLRLLLLCVVAIGFAGVPMGCKKSEETPPAKEKKEKPSETKPEKSSEKK